MEKPRIVGRAAVATAALLLVAACGEMPPRRSDEVFAHIAPGMTMEQVRDRLGKPDETMPFAATRTVAWSYFYYDTWGFYSEESITFDAGGRVMSKFSKRVGYGGNGHH